jgi:hypothetical protein
MGSLGLFHAEPAKPQIQIVLLRTYVSTNTIPGYIGGANMKPEVDKDGIMRPQAVNAIAITHPPRTEVVTNYVLGYWDGTNAVELLTTVRMRKERP